MRTARAAAESLPRPALVVAIGASAGGIAALKPLLAGLNPAAPVAVVLLQHADPARTPELCRVLAQGSALPVSVATEGEALAGGRAYLLPADRDCEIRGGCLHLLARERKSGLRHGIDQAMDALAGHYGERTAGVLLSGTGTDGSRGLRAIKAAGGAALVQSPDSAEYRGMPQAAIDAGLADRILAPDAIPAELERLLHWRPPPPETAELDELIELLRHRTGQDYGQYANATLALHLNRRMLFADCASLADYSRHLERCDDEVQALSRDLRMSTARFFERPEDFAALTRALHPLVARRRGDETLRVWVAGCATGEHAYALGIVLRELIDALPDPPGLQIFATDADAEAVRAARQGLYPPEVLRSVPQALRERHFEAADGLLRVHRALRDSVVFAKHELLTQPPFSRIDLVSCQGVLPRLRRPAQQTLLGRFHYALAAGGLLLLGPGEDTQQAGALFERAAEDEPLYRRRDVTTPITALPGPAETGAAQGEGRPTRQPQTRLAHLRQLLSDVYAPPCVLASARGEVLAIQGDVSPYLRLPAGETRVTLPQMATTPALAAELERLLARLAQAAAGGPRTERAELPLLDGEPPHALTLVGSGDERGEVLVVFERHLAQATASATAAVGEVNARLSELRRERDVSRAQLSANIEEFQAANEELQSVNEEFQSTNDELNSTVAELRTVNYHLASVNAELAAKSDALETAYGDMQGLFDNLATAILVLDEELRLSRYSPASTRLFELTPGNIGQRLAGLKGTLELDALSGEIEAAAREGHGARRNLTAAGRRYQLDLIPRLDREGHAHGVILTFTDETERYQAERDRRLLYTVIRDTSDAVIVRDLADRILTWNPAAERLLGHRAEAVSGEDGGTLLPPPLATIIHSQQQQLEQGHPRVAGNCKWRAADGRAVEVAVTSSRLLDEQQEPFAIATTLRDISEEQASRRALEQALKAAANATQAKSRFLAAASHDLRQPLQSLNLYLETARGDVGTGRRLAILGKMQQSLAGMGRVLNGLLDLSRLSAGQVSAQPRAVVLEPLIQQVLSQVQAEANAKGLTLRHVPCRLTVRTDPDLLEVLLSNLVFNAVKYTARGRVLVGCRRGGADGQLRLMVVDTGPGIAPEHREAIFEEFIQLSAPTSSTRGGLGLGLSIVRHLSELLNHELTLDSRVGHGSCFSLRLPIYAAPAELAAPARADPVIGARVLVVDDDSSVREATAMLLELEGLVPLPAAGVDEALAAARASPPDLAIVDYRLGGRKLGLELVERLRELTGRPALPVILVTGESQTELAGETVAAGCRLLIKPVHPRELTDLISELLLGAGAAPA